MIQLLATCVYQQAGSLLCHMQGEIRVGRKPEHWEQVVYSDWAGDCGQGNMSKRQREKFVQVLKQLCTVSPSLPDFVAQHMAAAGGFREALWHSMHQVLQCHQGQLCDPFMRMQEPPTRVSSSRQCKSPRMSKLACRLQVGFTTGNKSVLLLESVRVIPH